MRSGRRAASTSPAVRSRYTEAHFEKACAVFVAAAGRDAPLVHQAPGVAALRRRLRDDQELAFPEDFLPEVLLLCGCEEERQRFAKLGIERVFPEALDEGVEGQDVGRFPNRERFFSTWKESNCAMSACERRLFGVTTVTRAAWPCSRRAKSSALGSDAISVRSDALSRRAMDRHGPVQRPSGPGRGRACRRARRTRWDQPPRGDPRPGSRCTGR